MQAASLCFTAPVTVKSSWSSVPTRPLASLRGKPSTRATVAAAASTSKFEPLSVNYNSKSSVFPAEACETVGGDACAVEMFPEVNLAGSSSSKAEVGAALEEVDREYLDYSEAKTVFPGEACDDLGGEFCEAEYQEGVYKEKAAA